MTQEQFIEKAKKNHGDSYDYSKVEYNSSKSMILIRCIKHDNWFRQNAFRHSTGATGCQFCISQKRSEISKKVKRLKSAEYYIDKINKKFPGLFGCSNIKYHGSNKKIEITCLRCGLVNYILPKNIETSKDLCKKCGHIKAQKNRVLTQEQFIERANKVHNNKYDYSKIQYKNIRTKISIVCKKCGNTFLQKPSEHLEGHGCRICGNDKTLLKKTTKQFIEAAISLHGDLFDYSKVNYITNDTNVLITCKKCGNTFSQKPRVHLSGSGCPHCQSSSGERKITKFLKENKIQFKKEKTFSDCINPKTGRRLKFDFYLLDKNTIIEYNGKQHYEPIVFYGGVAAFKKLQERDKIKQAYCSKENIKLVVIKYNDNLNEALSVFL